MKKKTKIILITVAIILALACVACIVVNHYLNKIRREQLDDIVAPADETFETDDQNMTEEERIAWTTIQPFMDDDLLNILLVGQDRRPGQGRQRSDTMILCSVNLKTEEVSLISFMRDLYVQIPGDYSDNRLNAAYVFGGFPLLKDTLHLNFGVSVDGCFEVDFDGFRNIIDSLGGVDIELTEAEVPYVGDGAVAGMNHLNGEQALSYARIRIIDSDFVRTERQRYVLTSVFDKVKNSGLSGITSMVNEMLPYMTTDLSNAQIMAIAMQCSKIMSGATVETYCVPSGDDYYSDMIRGMAVLVPDLQMIRQEMESYLPLD